MLGRHSFTVCPRAVALAACTGSGSGFDGGADAGPPDAGAVDGGDAGADAGVIDGSLPDGGDAGSADAGVPFTFDFIVSPGGGAGAGTLADPWSLAYAIGIGAGTARGDGKLPASGARVGLRAGLYSRT